MSLNKPIPFPHKKYGMYYVEEDLRDAAYRGDVERIKKLGSQYSKLNFNATNEYGETAIYIATKRNQDSAVSHLLNQPGIDIEIPTILGNKCLLIAAWNDNTELAKKLIDHGADIHARTNPDRQYHGNVSALDIAEERGNKALVDYIEQVSPSSKQDLNPRPSV